jgi:Zn finger protein HypA/HybF involved in hydrogenase expression
MAKRLWEILLQSALETEEYEISCLECFNLLDQYADLLLEGADPQEIMPTVRQHLNHCPTCTSEFEALVVMLQEAAKNRHHSSSS